jgi:hypothetical protein
MIELPPVTSPITIPTLPARRTRRGYRPAAELVGHPTLHPHRRADPVPATTHQIMGELPPILEWGWPRRDVILSVVCGLVGLGGTIAGIIGMLELAR